MDAGYKIYLSLVGMKLQQHKIDPSLKPSFLQRLFRPVDNSALIAFRIAFGFLLFYHCFTFLTHGGVYNDLIHPPFTFTYIGFEFLQPLPGNGMYYYVMLMMLLALMIMLGAWYRFAMTVFAFLWTILYLTQKADYNNHYYLILLLCWIMVLMPANRYCSLDVKRDPSIQTNSCPQYCTWIFIAQIAIVYFFAGINKFCPEWLSGKFIAIWFNWFSAHHFFGRIYGYKLFQWTICYGGIVADLFIVPLLFWKKTRNYAFVFSCFFHLFNSYVFSIGIFPYLCLVLNLFFWIRKLSAVYSLRTDQQSTIEEMQ
jgi:vitamin K-dependent gamma-carboxylase